MSKKTLALEDCVILNYGKGLPERNREIGDVPVYGSSGIVGFHKEALVQGPGIIVGRKGTIGSVYWESHDFFPIDTTYYVSLKLEQTKLKFMYYLLRSLPLSKLNTDAAVPGLNRNNAYRLEIELPSSEVQDKIADILSAYDDLIENNRRRIQLLELLAHLLYKEWFVYFRFPGHEHVKITDGVPDGWEKVKLGDKVVFNYGKALKADYRIESYYPVYGSSGIIGTHEEPLVKGPGIIIGRKGNVGSVFWSSKDFYPIDTVYFINSETSDYYLYNSLKNMQFVNSDGAVPGLNRNYAYSKSYLIPDFKLLSLFEETVSPIYEQIHKLGTYNEKLIQARNFLLPRLMSGEIAV
jgi:type I restriction enzyme S subunit